MTRIRLLGRFSSWTVPTILSALIFGSLHGYEGVAGVTLITIYGALLSLLYIRTKSIWPCVIAHFFQDLQYVFLPPT
jgi:membrane protease YdiL (CAAX protease family)